MLASPPAILAENRRNIASVPKEDLDRAWFLYLSCEAAPGLKPWWQWPSGAAALLATWIGGNLFGPAVGIANGLSILVITTAVTSRWRHNTFLARKKDYLDWMRKICRQARRVH